MKLPGDRRIYLWENDMKRIIAMLTVLALCLSVFAACGKTEQTSEPDTKAEQTTGETKTEETKPEETKPEETKPEETKPEETKPEETKPAEPEKKSFKPEGLYINEDDELSTLSVTKYEDGYAVEVVMDGMPMMGVGQLEDETLEVELTNWTKGGNTVVDLTPAGGRFVTMTVMAAGGLKSVSEGDAFTFIPGIQPMKSDPHGEDDYTGVWAEEIAHRGAMNIQYFDGDRYTVTVTWPQSAAQVAMWYLPAVWHDHVLTYENASQVLRTYNEDGTYSEECLFTDGAGRLMIDDDGNLIWTDLLDKDADPYTFVRAD